LFTFPGAPSLYYGDEIGLTGALPPDKWARKTFPWDHPQQWDLEMLALHKTLIALRRSNPALRTGAYTHLHADSGSYAFARDLADHTLLTAVNVADQPRRLRIPLRSTLLAPTSILLATRGSPTAELVSGTLTLTLPARSGTVIDVSSRDAHKLVQ
jgi:glycosidase